MDEDSVTAKPVRQ